MRKKEEQMKSKKTEGSIVSEEMKQVSDEEKTKSEKIRFKHADEIYD